ncbi:hypothetical protein [Phenylobacterium sp.]|uniref:hypothetical protein n=1 Tax=Phenylobacterium sp. TaxID=1871053 RepID=UPI0035AE9CD3
MSDANVLREYLVSVGFKVDEAGLKRLNAQLHATYKAIESFAATAAAMGVAATAAVTQVASKFESLYYASQRIGASVENIRGFDLAISNLGGTAQGARGALESVAEFLRSNPGGESFLARIGVETRDANGRLRDMTAIVGDLGQAFGRMQYWYAKQIATSLGIDPITLQALRRGDLAAQMKRAAEMAAKAGVDQEAAAEASQRWMVRLRDLLFYLNLVKDRLLLILEGPADRIITWLQDANNRTAAFGVGASVLVGILGSVIGGSATGILGLVAALGLLIDDFMTWREGGQSLIDWSKWQTEIDQARGAIKVLQDGFKGLTDAIGDVAQAFWTAWGPEITHAMHLFVQGAIGDLVALGEALKAVAALLRKDWAGAWRHAKKAGWALAHPAEAAAENAAPSDRSSAPGATAAPSPGAAAGATGDPMPSGRGRRPVSIRNNNPGNLRRWGSRPTQDGFAVFDTVEAGMLAMARNLLGYAKRGDDTIREIISKWAPSSENDTGAYIRTVAKALGVSADKVLNLKDPATLTKLMQAISRQEAGGEFYSPALYRAAANMALGMPKATLGAGAGPGGTQVSLNQKTEITVNGVSDPVAAGRAVLDGQARVNADLIRYTKRRLG